MHWQNNIYRQTVEQNTQLNPYLNSEKPVENFAKKGNYVLNNEICLFNSLYNGVLLNAA